MDRDPRNDPRFPVAHTDRLLGLGQWPSTAADHQFGVGGDQSLTVSWDFAPSRYESSGPPPAEGLPGWRRKALADAETYRRALMQIWQRDVTLAIVTTLDAGAEHILDPTGTAAVVTYLTQAHTFLQTLGNGNSPYVPPTPGVAPDAGQPDLPDPVSIATPITAAPAADIVELTVCFVVAREVDLVTPSFRDDTLVYRATTVVQPYYEPVPDPKGTSDDSGSTVQPPTHRLDFYAKQLEDAYATADVMVKVATGSSRDELSGAQTPLWVVMMSKSDAGSIFAQLDGDPAFFAPSPLANNLLSMNAVPLYSFDPQTGGISHQPDRKVNFTGVDMDKWAQIALVAIDGFIEPQTAMSAYILDRRSSSPGPATTHLADILEAKAKLAAAIAARVDPILDRPELDPDADADRIKNARDKMEQRLLIELGAAYTVDAVVSYPVDVKNTLASTCSNPADSTPPRLFGVPVVQTSPAASAGSSALPKDHRLSTFKVDLDEPSSYLSFVFSIKRERREPSYTLDIDFHVTHIEHQICPVPSAPGFETSSWLDFVIPLPALPLSDRTSSDVTIPVLLRAYPSPPSLTNQEAVASLPPDPNGSHEPPLSANKALHEAKRWDYLYTYWQVHAAQDQIDSAVTLNHPDDPLLRSGPPANTELANTELLVALAQLVSVIDDLQQVFSTKLSVISMASSQAELDAAAPAVAAFAKLVGALPSAWLDWVQPVPPDTGLHTAEEVGHYQFTIGERGITTSESASATDGECAKSVEVLGVDLTVNDSEPDINAPTLQFAGYPHRVAIPDHDGFVGYQDDDGAWLSWSEALKLPPRTVEFDEMNALQYRNTWSSVRVTRNRDLIDGHPTRDDFVYATPYVKFSNKLPPFLDSAYPIDVAAVGADTPQSRPLWKHLQVMFVNLFEGAPADLKRWVKIEAVYRYDLAADAAAPSIELPVVLAPPFAFSVPGDWSPNGDCQDCGDLTAEWPFVCAFACTLLDWMAQHTPSTQGAEFRFDLSVFASGGGTGTIVNMPLIRLRDLVLATGRITDLPSGS